MQIYEELKARGLIAQVTNEAEISEMVNNGKATFYIGFDCTADSLTAGHFMALTLIGSAYSLSAAQLKDVFRRHAASPYSARRLSLPA